MSKISGQPPVRGRNKYEQWLTEDGLAKLQAWARNGLTDEQIAHNCGIGVRTLFTWKEKHEPIMQALKEGKEVVDLQVENALFKSACGYDYQEVTEEYNGLGELVSRKVFQKHQPPSNTAQIYWLKNRKRDVWKENHDKAEIERLRYQLDKDRFDADSKQSDGPRKLEIIIDPDAEDWGD
jgi:hypothetical protein